MKADREIPNGEEVADSISEPASRVPAVASKFRRALRNRTGVHLTFDELRDFALAGALELATRIENEELTKWQRTTRSTSSANTGSTSVETAELQQSGRSPDMSLDHDRSYIRALGLTT